MSFASNLAALARLLTATASGIVSGKAPAAGDSSTALINSAWFKAEQATEATQGTTKIATQTQTTAGTDDTTTVTPKKLRAGFAISLGVNGYIALPTWLGGLIIQWGGVSTSAANTNHTWTFPLAFPTAGLVAFVQVNDAGGPYATSVTSSVGKTSLTFQTSDPNTSRSHLLLAIGY